MIQVLNSLGDQGSGINTVNVSIQLLEVLAATNLHEGDHARILIPNEKGHLCPITKIYFNDVGLRAMHVALPGGVTRAHSQIGYNLAKALRLNFIGHSDLKPLFEDDDDMSESLTTRISGVLLGYERGQFFGEFLANAQDAQAKTFAMLLDEKPASPSNVLSPAFEELQSYPSLIIYNDSVFEESDFKGIRKVGLGGKKDKSDTIGQFGLGCLSMYHFTEVSQRIARSSF